MADEEIKSNLDAPLYGARVVSPLCHACANYDGLDKDWHRKKAYRCKEYYIWHKDVPYDSDTWAEVVDKKAKEEEEYWSTPPWERGILKSK